MIGDDLDFSYRKPPRTTTVLVFLAAFALIVSWLAIYAIPNALRAANLMEPLLVSREDPRPAWMIASFGALFLVCTVIGTLFVWTSRRQLTQIDAIGDSDFSDPYE